MTRSARAQPGRGDWPGAIAHQASHAQAAPRPPVRPTRRGPPWPLIEPRGAPWPRGVGAGPCRAAVRVMPTGRVPGFGGAAGEGRVPPDAASARRRPARQSIRASPARPLPRRHPPHPPSPHRAPPPSPLPREHRRGRAPSASAPTTASRRGRRARGLRILPTEPALPACRPALLASPQLAGGGGSPPHEPGASLPGGAARGRAGPGASGPWVREEGDDGRGVGPCPCATRKCCEGVCATCLNRQSD